MSVLRGVEARLGPSHRRLHVEVALQVVGVVIIVLRLVLPLMRVLTGPQFILAPVVLLQTGVNFNLIVEHALVFPMLDAHFLLVSGCVED